MLFIRNALLLVPSIAVTIVLFSVGIPVALLSPRTGHIFIRAWSRYMLWAYRIKVVIIDENEGDYRNHGTLFVTLNQTSLSEGVIGTYAIPTAYRLIMSIQMALFPILGWYYAASRGPILFPFWKKQAKWAMNRGVQDLHERCNFWMSIEGRRSKDGKLCPFKKGASVMAIKAQANIVPIIYTGAREVMPYGAWKLRPGKVYVRLCKAISTRGMALDDRTDLTNELRKIATHHLTAESSPSAADSRSTKSAIQSSLK